jgi:hypothetical protein
VNSACLSCKYVSCHVVTRYNVMVSIYSKNKNKNKQNKNKEMKIGEITDTE